MIFGFLPPRFLSAALERKHSLSVNRVQETLALFFIFFNSNLTANNFKKTGPRWDAIYSSGLDFTPVNYSAGVNSLLMAAGS